MKIRLSKSRIMLIELVFMIMLCTYYLIPNAVPGNTMLLGLLLVYSCYIALLDRELRPLILRVILLTVILGTLYVLLTDESTIAQTVSGRGIKRFFSRLYQYFTLFFPAILFFRVHHACTTGQKKLILLFSIVCVGYITFNTRIYLLDNPNAARNWEGFDEITALNVANYYYVIAYPILVAVAVACLARLKIQYKVICIAAIVVAMEFLIAAQYTLSILVAAVGICFQIGQSIHSRNGKVIYSAGMVILALFIPSILEIVIQLIPSEQVTTRLSEILDFLTGHGAGGYNLNGRLTLYGRSILAFLTSPVWGNRHLDFNGHASFLTILADTGLLGGIPFYYLLNMIIKSLRNALDEHRNQFKTAILAVVLTGLTNPIHASLPLGFAAWFIAPLMVSIVFRKEAHFHEEILGN